MTVSCVQYTQCMCLRSTWLWSCVGVCDLVLQFNLVVELWGGQKLMMESGMEKQQKSEGLKMCGTIFFIEGVCEGGYEHLR